MEKLGKRHREGKAMTKGRVINSSYFGQLSFISLRKLWEPVSIYIKKKKHYQLSLVIGRKLMVSY